MNSAENTEECLDLYDDILVEDLTCQQDSLHEIDKKYKEALRTIAVLKDIKSQNEASITTLQKKNAYLMNNISVLYKTACVELERKKATIESLQNERNSGFDYNYKDTGRNQMQASPYGNNTYESQNHKPYENAIAPYNHLKWNSQYADPHPFSPSNSSIYPNDSVAATHIDAPHGTHDYSSPYAFPNLAHQERSDKHVSHNSHTSRTAESTYTKSYTSPMRNTDSYPSDQDLSFCASQQPRYVDSHTRYFDEHVPCKKQTDFTSHGKHSNRKQSGSSSSHSKHSSSKTSTSSHNDKRPSSLKTLHSDSRKHNTHSSSTHRSESSSSRSKHSESKNSGRSSRVSSKDTSTSSSTSSSRSRHRKPHASNLCRSNSSDSKHKTEKYREQKTPVENLSTEDDNLVNSKRKLPHEFSKINKSDPKRKRKEESKSTKESASRSTRKEKTTKSHCKKQDELGGGNTKYKNSSSTETDRSVSLERNEKISDSEVLKSDPNESPLPTGQDLETDNRMMLDVLLTDDKPLDHTLREATESHSLESVTRETDDAIVSASINSSSTSENNPHESDIEDKAGDVEREPDKSKQLDTEASESCKFVLCTAKDLSDSEENLVCREAETELEAEKLDSLSDTQSSCKKEETSGRSSDVSDAKSDSSDDPKNRSIIIQCFGNADDASHSPIIIPCYPSKKNKSKSSSSASDSDEEYVSRDHLMSSPSKRLIARSLFPVTQPSIKKLPDMLDDSETLKSKQNIDNAFEGSIMSKVEEEQLEKADSNQGSEKSCSSDVSAAKSTRTLEEVGCDNLDVASSPILEKLSDDLMLTTEEYNARHWLDKDIETASSTKEDHHSDTSLDDNDDENCYPQNDAEYVDKNNISDDGLEEGEILTDDENELVTDTVTTTEQATTVRSLVRYHKSFSPLDRRKNHSKRNREACRRKPHRESLTNADSRNSRVLSLHTDHFSKQSYRRDDGRSWQKKLPSSRSRQLDSYHRRSDIHYKSRDRSSSANGKRRTR